ncbi:hypothetical protein Chor_001320 [Crotalus horridus]
MHLHQVLTGAVNPGDNCYSVGSVDDTPFTAYGSGCDIVILANDFECVQIIPGAKHGNIQVSCVECSQQGRIAASYGNTVCIFEPLGINSHKRNCVTTQVSMAENWTIFPYFHDLQLGMGSSSAEGNRDDCLLKVWYPMMGWKSSLRPQEGDETKKISASIHFAFVYLSHPRAVTGVSWRHTSKFMPRFGTGERVDDELSLDRESETGTGSSDHDDGEKEGSPKILSPAAATVQLPTVLLDRKIELLLKEWNQNPDMLFTIHPVDGTFLVWHVKHLDEYNPGIFRQVQIPVAFPSGDASSLSKHIMMYACPTFSKESTSAPAWKRTSISDSLSGCRPSRFQDQSSGNLCTPTVMMISKHIDGSLNQWAVSFADKSAFTTVHTVTHKFRYCGHRFHLNDLACHSVLPLLLTSSHHNALLTPEVDAPWDLEGLNKSADAMHPTLRTPAKQHLQNAATRTFYNPDAIYSELILWRVDPIGPLSYTGGVSELARINSLHTSAFSNVAWLPTLIPSYCLGTYCNSASACFVASDGKNLRLYQAVVDARKLLDELSDPGASKLIGEIFNIVSQQSTARPGCIIELDVITDQCGSSTQLLHVFQEDFILGYKPQKEEVEQKETEIFFQPSKGYRPPPFSEKFYLIVIEKDTKGCSILHMWHLHLKSVQANACLGSSADVHSLGHQLTLPGQPVADSSPETSSGTMPMLRSSSVANLQTASKLILSSSLVYSYPLDLPPGVEVVRATPSAGHLSSSSIYPVCLAPYLLVTSCSDNKVRFWKCSLQTTENGQGGSKETYSWKKWPLMNDEQEDTTSTVCIVGRPVAVSCSYTGRLAIAYKQPIQQSGVVSKEFSMHVCIFECESTGGSEWVLEQTIHLDDLVKVGSVLDSRVSIDSNLFVYSKSEIFLNKDRYLIPNIKHLVHLDWVSKEDGSHILTVGVGANIFMYGRISGIVTEQTSSKDGVAVITLPLGGSIKQGIRSRWILLRSIDLVSSVDGTPSLPVSLSWVRDGILVVGMDCEMHVYAQWKHALKSGNGESDGFPPDDSPVMDPFKANLLAKKASIIDGAGIVDDVFGTPTVLQDGGLFEAAHMLSPTLPQYHPTQLLELMDLGKVRRAKAILSHLVKCIAGEVAIVKDLESADGGSKRHLSRTISVSGSTAKDAVTTGKEGTRDYTEIDSIPPLPLYALLAADQDSTYKTEEAPKQTKGREDRSKRKTEDQYSDLFQVQQVTTDDFIDFEPERREHKSRVINLSQYGPTYFGQEHARRDTLDECGLRYLLAMRLHTCLLTSLPPLYRVQLLHQGCQSRLPEEQRCAGCCSFLSRNEKKGRGLGTISVCLEKMEDIQLALIIARLYESEFEISSTYTAILYEKILGFIVKSCNPVVFSFYNYLRTHPLLIRRNFCSPDGTLATLGLQAEKSFVDKINLIERKLFFTTANAHFKVGCPVLALEVLSKLPKIRSRSTLSPKKGESTPVMQNGLEVDEGSTADWSQPVGTTEAPSLIDWSKPMITFEDEPLKLDWGNDQSSLLEEEEEKGLTMNDLDSKEQEVPSPDPSQGKEGEVDKTEVDVIAEQLKFRACLKILMTELRTLATGYEVDGGKLRFQLYNWLEKEIAALHEICNHEATQGKDDGQTDGQVSRDLLGHQEMGEMTPVGSYERHQIERRRLQAKREHAERRKWWLQRNQALLRVFLSYCSLHGAQGGGLASETTVKQLQSPLPLPTTLPLLSASIAATKTVIANPVLYLNNHIHDILYTIVQMKMPPHPNVEDVKPCVTATATGVSSLINLLSSAQDEDQPKLNILLCEAVVSVYLSLLIHALATNASNELFRLAAHPLNNRMWAAVFGGGVKLVVKPRRQSENIPDKPQHLSTNTGTITSFGNSQLPHHTALSGINQSIAGCDSGPLDGEEYVCWWFYNLKLALWNQMMNVPVCPHRLVMYFFKLCLCLAPPVPSEETDKHRRRFNMRMLVPGRPPFLPFSDSGVMYDSDESIHSEDDDEDAFLSDMQIQEHKDANSYSWALIHLAMIKLALNNIKNFFPITGLELTELPVTSPLGTAVIKNLENWEQILQERMDHFEGPPPDYINTCFPELGLGAGAAAARIKAMVDPENTPFKSKDYSALPAKRLWHFLVKQELLQDTFIRYTFTKKRKQSESVEDREKHVIKQSSPAEDGKVKVFTHAVTCLDEPVVKESLPLFQVEAELGYPGGRAKIIHKESDMILAFAVNKANINEIVLASTHDVQELDVSALLAAQPYIWIGEEFDGESKSKDPNPDLPNPWSSKDSNPDLPNHGQAKILTQISLTHGPAKILTQISLTMVKQILTQFFLPMVSKVPNPDLPNPWSSKGPNPDLPNHGQADPNPVLPTHDDVDFRGSTTTLTQSSAASFAVAQMQHVSNLSTSSMPWLGSGQTSTGAGICGVADGEGFLSIWQVNQTSSNPKPYLSWQCHSKTTSDFAFITSSSLVATSGQSNDNRCVQKTKSGGTVTQPFTCHEHGATVLQYAPKHQLLISGGRKGHISIFDIRQRQALHTFQAHDSAIKALALDSSEECFCTGSAEGNVKVWRLTGYGLIHSFKHEHAKQSIFRNLSTGVMQIEMAPGNRIFSCGADGTLKMRVLPNAFNIPSDL